MENQLSTGKLIKSAREQKGLSQAELAGMCYLNIRTIQRIENDEVTPRPYTLRIIGKVLNITLIRNGDNDTEKEQIRKLRSDFQTRKNVRIALFVTALFVMATALFLLIAGIPKRIWAPFYILMIFSLLIGILFSWRCPGCNSLLGDVFSSRFCPHCGLRFYNESQ